MEHGLQLSSFDIAHAARDGIHAMLEPHGIDFDKVLQKFSSGYTDIVGDITFNPKKKGKARVWMTPITKTNGYPDLKISFNSFISCESGGFTCYRLIDSPISHIPAPAVKKQPKVDREAEYSRKMRRFLAEKKLFEELPVVTDLSGTYLERKGFTVFDLPDGFVLKHGADDWGQYVVYALRNASGAITGFQKIYDANIPGRKGNKHFIFEPDRETGNTLKNGSYAILGDANASTAYVAEGLSTALSVFVSTGKTVIIALDAGNLLHVAMALKPLYQNIIIAADNDTTRPNNPGITKATNVALATGARVVYPEMGDFNDVYLALGFAEVKRQITENFLPLNFKNTAPVSHKVTNLNTRFLPTGLLKNGGNIIRSTYGSGKTEDVARDIEANPGDSVLYVAPLVTLCKQAANRFGSEDYQEHKTNLHDHPKLSICINSLPKLTRKDGTLPIYDVVVLDEVEPLLTRLTDTGSDAIKNKSSVLEVLKYLIKNAKKVVCLDADISQKTIEFMEYLRPNESFNIVNNDYCHSKNLHVYSSEAEIIELIKAAVSRGEPSLVATNSIEKSFEIAKLVGCEQTRTRIINSETSGSAENRAFLANINEQCINDLLTIVSPSVSTGFSIESGHYKHNFGIFSHQVNSPLDCLQQLERDRVVVDKHVYISPIKSSHAVKRFDAAHDYSMATINGYGEWVFRDECYSRLVERVNQDKAEVAKNFKKSFIDSAKLKGYIVNDVEPTIAAEDIKQHKVDRKAAKQALNDERIAGIVAAESLDQCQYEKMKKQVRQTADELAQIEKYELEQFYKMPATPELVALDDNGERREQISAVKLATGTREAAKTKQFNSVKGGMFAEDVNYYLVRYMMLSRVLGAVGIDADLNLTKDVYAADDVAGLIDWLDSEREVLAACYPNIPTRSDLIKSPYKFIGQILRSMGIKQKRINKRSGDKVWAAGYAVDKMSLEQLKPFL